MSKVTKAVLAVLVVISLAVLSLFAASWVVILLPDTPPPTDATMLPAWKKNSGQGPLADFQKWLRLHPISKSDPQLRKLMTEEGAVLLEGQAFIQKHHDVLDHYEALAKTDPSTWSWANAPEIVSGEPIESIDSLRALADVISVHIENQIVAGRYREAGSESARLIQVGLGFQKADGNLIPYLMGSNYIANGVSGFERIARSGGGTVQNWQEWQSFLEANQPELTDFSNALKVEYFAFKQMAANLARNQQASPKPSRNTALIKPNASCQYYLDLFEPIMSAIPKDDWTITALALNDQEHRLQGSKGHWISRILSRNPGGDALAESSPMRACGAAITRHYAPMVLIRCAVCNIAIHRFALETGKLPTTLAELTPRFLAKVPLDPFDKRPLRWDPKRGAIYSIGPDLKDDGGRIDTRTFSNGQDWGKLYWWRENLAGHQ